MNPLKEKTIYEGDDAEPDYLYMRALASLENSGKARSLGHTPSDGVSFSHYDFVMPGVVLRREHCIITPKSSIKLMGDETNFGEVEKIINAEIERIKDEFAAVERR